MPEVLFLLPLVAFFAAMISFVRRQTQRATEALDQALSELNFVDQNDVWIGSIDGIRFEVRRGYGVTVRVLGRARRLPPASFTWHTFVSSAFDREPDARPKPRPGGHPLGSGLLVPHVTSSALRRAELACILTPAFRDACAVFGSNVTVELDGTDIEFTAISVTSGDQLADFVRAIAEAVVPVLDSEEGTVRALVSRLNDRRIPTRERLQTIELLLHEAPGQATGPLRAAMPSLEGHALACVAEHVGDTEPLVRLLTDSEQPRDVRSYAMSRLALVAPSLGDTGTDPNWIVEAATPLLAGRSAELQQVVLGWATDLRLKYAETRDRCLLELCKHATDNAVLHELIQQLDLLGDRSAVVGLKTIESRKKLPARLRDMATTRLRLRGGSTATDGAMAIAEDGGDLAVAEEVGDVALVESDDG